MTYIKALGLIWSILLVLFFLLYQAASVMSNVWLSEWTEDPILKNDSIPTNSSTYVNKRDMYLGVYGGLGAMQGIQHKYILIISYTLHFQPIPTKRIIYIMFKNIDIFYRIRHTHILVNTSIISFSLAASSTNNNPFLGCICLTSHPIRNK